METSDIISLGALIISGISLGLTWAFEVMKKPKLEYFLRFSHMTNAGKVTQVNVTFEIYKAGFYPCVINKININGKITYLGADALYIADTSPKGSYGLLKFEDRTFVVNNIEFIDTSNRKYEIPANFISEINSKIQNINR